MTANFGKNQGVANTLDAYLRLDNPRFAVLLQGKWGSGKTWFIREYIKNKGNDIQQFCYVSLFGIEKLKEIDDQILASSSPLLSKAESLGRLAGALFERCTAVLKTADIEKIGELVKKWFSVDDNLVLILDDLERASIPIKLVLGYVSNMLDEVGIKVILLCDTEEISKEEKTFCRFKEKIVGTTITVNPDVETVFDTQVQLIQNPKIKKTFQDNKARILHDFETSRLDNLRNIKKIIYEFSICYNQMTTDMQNNHLFLSEFLHILFILTIEINKGISINDFSSKKAKVYSYYELYPYYDSFEKLPDTARWTSSISSKVIENLLYKGIVDRTLLHESYKKSEYSKNPEIPYELYNKINKKIINDSDANKLYDQMKIELDILKYSEANTILHAYDIMLFFSKIGIEAKNEKEIILLAKKYLSKILITDETFKLNNLEKNFSYLSNNSPSFHEIYTAICNRVTEIQQKKMDGRIRESSRLLLKNPDDFVMLFMVKHPADIKLTCLDAKKLAQRISLLDNKDLFNVMSVINDNIEHTSSKTSEDINWAKKFYYSLEEKLDTLRPLARDTLKNFLNRLKKLIHTEQ